MRKRLIAGNWKMNTSLEDAEYLTVALSELEGVSLDAEVLICPPFPYLMKLKSLLSQSSIKLGAQNLHHLDSGAYTGEVSAEMLSSIDCDYVIIGHSERRAYFSESNELINQKLLKAIEYSLMPILCVGESLAERESNQTFDRIREQLKVGLSQLSAQEEIVIAYEPVWAIGTGKVATPEQAQEVHDFIRKEILSLFDQSFSDKTRVLYGGSVKPENASELIVQQDIDGFLVGGASLKASDFSKIIHA